MACRNVLMATILCVVVDAYVGLAQGVYLTAGAGYGISAGTQYIGSNATSTGTTSSYEGVFGSFGEGFKFSASAGYMFNRNLGLELGASYWLGKSFEFTTTYPTSSSNYKWSGSGFQVVPSIVLSANMKTVNPYARLGVALGILKVTQETIYRPSGPTAEATFEETGGLALGVAGALGFIVPAEGTVSLFAEAVFHSISYSPNQAELTRYTIGGVDQLTSVEHTVTNYKDSFSTSESNTSMGVRRPFSAIGIVIGARFNL